jgi:hypothetical protein
MKFTELTEKDVGHVKNLITSIAKGKYEFSGIEAMAFTVACQWFNQVYAQMEADLRTKKALSDSVMKEAKKPDLNPKPAPKKKAKSRKKKAK